MNLYNLLIFIKIFVGVISGFIGLIASFSLMLSKRNNVHLFFAEKLLGFAILCLIFLILVG